MSDVGLISNFIDAWLSLVERCVRDEEVVGSNPVAPIFLYPLFPPTKNLTNEMNGLF